MGRYLIIGAAGLAATAAIWMFGFNATGTLPAGVSQETTASIATPQAVPARPTSTGSSDGHATEGVWVPATQRAQ